MSTERKRLIRQERVCGLLRLKDLTDPKNGISPISLLFSKIEQSLSASKERTIVVRGNPVVSLADNFDYLMFPQNSIMRSRLHTQYVDDFRVLRTQMSATAVEYIRNSFDGESGVFLFPGIVYRKEGNHHQLDVWKIKRKLDSETTTTTDIRELMDLTLRSCLQDGSEIKIERKELHYITDGIKAKIRTGQRWKTVFDGGQIIIPVLQNIGIDPDDYLVWAAGISLERLSMVIKGIEDPRLFRSTDPRVVSQMSDLNPYNPISFMPPITRDLSVPVSSGVTLDEIDSLVRIHTEEDVVESVEIVSETPFDQLPIQARKRLGIKPVEKNLLVRVTLRSFERTLKKTDANEIRDRLFEVLNHCDEHTIEELAKLPQTR